MSVRAALLRLHEKYCWPGFVPIVRVATVSAWTIAGLLIAYLRYVAGS